MTAPTHMTGPGRYLALSGVAFAVLMVAGAAAFPMPPGGDVSPAGRPDWLAAHTGAVIAQSSLRALAALAFIAFAAVVAQACRRALGEPSELPALALAGGTLSGGVLLAGQAVSLAAAVAARDGAPAGTIRALGALQDGFLDLASVPAVLLFAAAGLTALRTGLLPRWFAVVTLLGVPAALVDAGSYDGGPLAAFGLAGLGYFLAWSLLVGVRLTVVRGPAPVVAEPALAG